MSITFIMLMLVFVLAIGDATVVYLVIWISFCLKWHVWWYCNVVKLQLHYQMWPWSLYAVLVSFFAISSGASLVSCTYGVILETECILSLIKLMTSFSTFPFATRTTVCLRIREVA